MTENINVYHQNLPGASIAFAALVFAATQLGMCANQNSHTYHHTVHSDAAQRVCEAQIGRDDPRCIGYFAR
jgi:hypothetical protein